MKKNNKDEIIELLYNLKLLLFVEPKHIPILYKKLKKNITIRNLLIFINILKELGSPIALMEKIKKFQNGIIIIL